LLHPRVLTPILATGLLWLLFWAPPSWAEQRLRCVLCGQQLQQGYRIEGQVYCEQHYQSGLPHCHNCGQLIQGDYRLVGYARKPTCLSCLAGHPTCFLCAAPADPSRGGEILSDGRPLCGPDRSSAVFAQEQAQQLFAQAALEVQQALGPALQLRVPVQQVRLVDVDELWRVSNGLYEESTLRRGRVLGLTTLVLKRRGQQHWTEPATVYLLSGVPAERLLTVAAHEYAHIWQAENHPAYSSTSIELREGFAEWVAYKVAEQAGRQEQMAALDFPGDSMYYQGLSKLLALEARLGVTGTLRYTLSAHQL
jgi:hypothetical protein